jgi:hypothetical protein
VKPLAPTLMCRAEKCEYRINVGLFFDGTGNNQDWEGHEFTGGPQQEGQQRRAAYRAYRALCCNGCLPLQTGTEGNHRA